MIFEAIFEEAYQSALKYKYVVECGFGDTDKGIELYGRSSAFSDFITSHGLDNAYKKYLAERRGKPDEQ